MSNGQRSSVKLKVVQQNDEVVRLKREDNDKVVEFPIAQLSRGDREYLRSLDSQRVNLHQVDRAAYDSTVQPVLRQFCIKCHGSETTEAGLRLDDADLDFGKRSVAMRWTEIMDRINAGEMPPDDEPQPSGQQLTSVVEWIATELRRREAAIQSTGGQVVMRRMNRAEYNNTIRDLVGINFRPADDFPADPPAFGFDNIGAAQNVSPMQMEQYLAAAREVVDRAIVTGPRPKSVRWRVAAAGDQFRVDFQPDWEGERTKLHISLYDKNASKDGRVEMTPPHGAVNVVLMDRDFHPGDYVIRLQASASIPTREEVVAFGVGAYTPNEDTNSWSAEHVFPMMREHFRNELRFQYGPPRLRFTTYGEGAAFAEIDVDAPLDQPKVYEVRTRLESNSVGIRLLNVYNIPVTAAIHSLGSAGKRLPRPNLYLDWVEIEGPVHDAWPPTGYTKILFESDNDRDSPEYAREVLRRFMSRAWRRPVTVDEVEHKLQLFTRARPKKSNFEEAIKVPLIAVLSSPQFLYLTEPATDRETELSDYELASRLSYFLWSSMPDDELFQLASEKRLSDDGVLREQVDRMLADPKAAAFTENFAGQWLDLREVGVNPPSSEYFRRYDEHLRSSMIRESEGFFAEILHNDLPATNFIKSEFVTINERLSRFYNIDGVRGDHIRRVAVPEGVQRGGVLTQASMLTVTSNGTRTSPVMRGKWILDNILGDPPPPPPPDAGEIPQKVPGEGKVTVRERLELHRRSTACAACHNKIDPLGFALENFRGDGSWATQEANGWQGWINKNDPQIDPSATMPDGTQIDGLVDLQDELLKQEDKFLRCLAEKVATYALGRGMEYSDRQWLDSLATNMQSGDKTLRGLIQDIVASEQFKTK